MGISDKITAEDLEYIHLEHFMFVLNRSLDGTGRTGFAILPWLLNKGLQLYYTESGYVCDEQVAFYGDIKLALSLVEEKLFDTNESKSKIYRSGTVTTQDGLEVSLGNLFINRSNVEKVYFDCKETKYPWALVLWPQCDKDWKFFDVDIKLEGIQPQPEQLFESKTELIELQKKGVNKQPITRKRNDNLNRAIDAAIKVFGKKPSLDELWQYFQDDKDKTGFIEDYDDNKITWKDTKGKLHDTKKDSLANRLSRIKS